MFYKDYSPIIRKDDLCILQECLVVAFLLVFIDLHVKTKTSLNSFALTFIYLFPILMI